MTLTCSSHPFPGQITFPLMFFGFCYQVWKLASIATFSQKRSSTKHPTRTEETPQDVSFFSQSLLTKTGHFRDKCPPSRDGDK